MARYRRHGAGEIEIPIRINVMGKKPRIVVQHNDLSFDANPRRDRNISTAIPTGI
jgi:hypothetical protein